MEGSLHRRSALAAVLLPALLPCAPAGTAAAQALVPASTIELPGIHGRLDHLDLDLERGRLFVAALAAGSVEIVDLQAGMRTARLLHLQQPQGIAYLAGRLFVAEGSGVDVFENEKRIDMVGDLDDADNMRPDPATSRLYVGYGRALAELDAQTLRVVRRIALAGHPEAFELATTGPEIYVNVPSARQIVVIDRRSGNRVAHWTLAGATQNFPMALNEAEHRLFVATRRPARLLVFDSASGRRVAELPICGDADDLFFDGKRQQLYAVCGEGLVDVVHARDPDHYAVVNRVRTAPGARTGLFVARLATLFSAAAMPRRQVTCGCRRTDI